MCVGTSFGQGGRELLLTNQSPVEFPSDTYQLTIGGMAARNAVKKEYHCFIAFGAYVVLNHPPPNDVLNDPLPLRFVVEALQTVRTFHGASVFIPPSRAKSVHLQEYLYRFRTQECCDLGHASRIKRRGRDTRQGPAPKLEQQIYGLPSSYPYPDRQSITAVTLKYDSVYSRALFTRRERVYHLRKLQRISSG